MPGIFSRRELFVMGGLTLFSGGLAYASKHSHFTRPEDRAIRVGKTAPLVSDSDMARLRADPTYIAALYKEYRVIFLSRIAGINRNWTEAQTKTAFCSVLSYQCAPYGDGPNGWDLKALMNAPVLSCAGYIRILWMLYEILAPDDVDSQVAFGVMRGSVGNHEQMIYPGKESVLLDPTIGLIWSGVTFDALMEGRPIHTGWRSFRYRDDYELDGFASAVATAIYYGEYKPSDLLYYLPGLDNARKHFGFVTPQSWDL